MWIYNTVKIAGQTKIKMQIKTKSVMFRTTKKRRIIKRISASTMLVMLVGVFLLPEVAYGSGINDENIINLTNQTRTELGLGALNANQLLSKAAYDKADAIFSTQEFGHNINGEKFSTWVHDAGYDYQNVGENLAIDFVSSEGVMKAWMDSPSHKKNILNPKFQEIGVAVMTDEFNGSNSTVIVQIFGSPMSTQANLNTSIPNIKTSNQINLDTENEALLSNSAKNSYVIASTDSANDLQYLINKNGLQESFEQVEYAVLLLVDYTAEHITEFYWTLIMLLSITFSSLMIFQRDSLTEKL
mgnify:CR=1 FL=1